LGSAKTRKLIKDKTTAVWLQAKESELIKRLQSGKRPPLTDLPLHEEVRKFLLERGPHYREVAKVTVSPPVPFGKQVPSVLSDLKKLLRSR
jgi:shikimate kinase